jgi:hypothetical protein
MKVAGELGAVPGADGGRCKGYVHIAGRLAEKSQHFLFNFKEIQNEF